MTTGIIELAKSGRASCRKCRAKIEKGQPRFGLPSDMQYGESASYRWYHLGCAAAVDPHALEEALKSYPGEVGDRDALEREIAEAKSKTKPAFPYAEVAPSGRSKCMQCSEKIEKGSLRIAVEREVDTGAFVSRGAGYLHPGCAAEYTGDSGVLERVRSNSVNLGSEQLAQLS